MKAILEKFLFDAVLALFLVTAFLIFGQRSQSSEVVVVNHHEINVIDGDTIQIGDAVYQLAGIDAPELGQACDHGGHLWLCGLAAGHRLRKQIELLAMPIRCFVQARVLALPIATCMLGEEEVSVILLKGGNVAALPDGPPHYAAAEHISKQGSLGIWGGKFIPPWEWRKGKRLPNEHTFKGSSHPTAELPWKSLERTFLHLPNAGHAACMVKGDISGNNEHFYYGPLDREYEAIDINPQKGERFFCGDDEARDAGWKRKGERDQS